MAEEGNEQVWNSAEVLQEVALDDQLGIMAPLDLDKYAEIAKQCKYLPENDLKVNATLHIYFKLGYAMIL